MNYQNTLNSKIRVVSGVLWAGQEGKKDRLLHTSAVPHRASIYCADIWGSCSAEVAGAKFAEYGESRAHSSFPHELRLLVLRLLLRSPWGQTGNVSPVPRGWSWHRRGSRHPAPLCPRFVPALSPPAEQPLWNTHLRGGRREHGSNHTLFWFCTPAVEVFLLKITSEFETVRWDRGCTTQLQILYRNRAKSRAKGAAAAHGGSWVKDHVKNLKNHRKTLKRQQHQDGKSRDGFEEQRVWKRARNSRTNRRGVQGLSVPGRAVLRLQK